MSVQGRQRESEGEIRGVDAKLPRRVAVAAVGLWLQTVAVHDALGVGLPVNEDLTSANLRAKLDARPGELRRAAGGAGITQVFAGNDAKQILYPVWMLGTWTVKSELRAAAYPQGSPPVGLEGGTVRGSREKAGETLVFPQRFNGTSSRQLGSSSPELLVAEDKGYNARQVWQQVHDEPVLSTDFSPRMDAGYVKLEIDDGLGQDQPAAVYSFSTRRSSGDRSGATFNFAEEVRAVYVASRSVKVIEYETITQLQREADGTVRGRQRVVVWSAPEAVQDKIAKMRSLGSLKAWGALTKGTVKAGSIGVNIAGALSLEPRTSHESRSFFQSHSFSQYHTFAQCSKS